jgi:hypothetical protein
MNITFMQAANISSKPRTLRVPIKYYPIRNYTNDKSFSSNKLPYNNPANMATMAAPAGTPKELPAPWKLLAVALGADSDSDPVPVALAAALVALAAARDCVAATLATEAMDEEAAARRGSAAPQYEVTVFWTGGFSRESRRIMLESIACLRSS